MNAMAVLLVFLLLPALALAANVTGFEDAGFTVAISVNPDGTAHVIESVQIIVAPAMADLYKESLRSTRLTIDDWQRTTGSQNLRYHVLGGNVTPTNTHIFPQPLQRFTYVDRSVAVITVEYDTSAPIFTLSELGPRRTAYSLIPDTLSFENAPEGQILPENAVLIVNVLPNSQVDLSRTFPRPTTPTGSKMGTASAYMWNATGGAIPLKTFEFTFQTEQSIDEEVGQFFAGVQLKATALVMSSYGALAGLIVLILALLFFALRRAKLA